MKLISKAQTNLKGKLFTKRLSKIPIHQIKEKQSKL
jgi:hypothetical protein